MECVGCCIALLRSVTQLEHGGHVDVTVISYIDSTQTGITL